MTKRNMEKLAAERRMRQRGVEDVHGSGLALTRDLQSRRAADALARRIAAWKHEPSIEEQAEANRHVPLEGTGGMETRAQREEWSRAIREACED